MAPSSADTSCRRNGNASRVAFTLRVLRGELLLLRGQVGLEVVYLIGEILRLSGISGEVNVENAVDRVSKIGQVGVEIIGEASAGGVLKEGLERGGVGVKGVAERRVVDGERAVAIEIDAQSGEVGEGSASRRREVYIGREGSSCRERKLLSAASGPSVLVLGFTVNCALMSLMTLL